MNRFSRILFVASADTDDSEALNQAVTLANNNQAKLTVVGVIDASEKEKAALEAGSNLLLDAVIKHRRGELESLVASASTTRPAIEVKVLVGKGFLEVIREVLRHHCDLIIKSAEANNGIGRLFSSTDMKLLRKSPCPLWVINSTQQHGYRGILAALDYDPENANVDVLNGQIIEMATSLALANFAELHLVHVWHLQHENYLRSLRTGLSVAEVDAMVQEEDNKRRTWLEALVKKHCARQGKEAVDYLKPQLHLPQGDASHLVPVLVTRLGAELVVMGTVGRTGIPGVLIGNTAETISNRIDCSV